MSSKSNENITKQLLKADQDLVHRLYFEFTNDGFLRTALIEQVFVSNVPSIVLFDKQTQITNSFCSVDDFVKEVKEKIKIFVVELSQEINKIKKTNHQIINKKIGTTIILPIELVQNTFFKKKIKNNYIKTDGLEKMIENYSNGLDKTTEIFSDRKEIISGNLANKGIFKIDKLPRKLHSANLYVSRTFLNTSLYKWLDKTLHKNKYVGETFYYSELKGIFKSFSFWKINDKLQPKSENMVAWRNEYCLLVSSTNSGFSKTKISGGYNKLLSDLKQEFNIGDEELKDKILNHSWKKGNEEEMDFAILGKDYVGTRIETLDGHINLTNEEIQQRVQKVIAKSLQPINSMTNNQETIHFGMVNHLKDFDVYLKRINQLENSLNYELLFDFKGHYTNTSFISKNILMFALNEKTEFISDNGNKVLSKQQAKKINDQLEMNKRHNTLRI